MQITRRAFLRAAAALAGAGGLRPSNRAAGAADAAHHRVRLAVIGAHTRGLHHIRSGFAGRPGCEVAVVCDADRAMAGPALDAAERLQGRPPRFVQDFRRVLDDRSIDAVSIAMPDHWHALAAIWAMQAGKDVYVEKPISHNVREGRRLVEAAQRYGRICQAGMQIRSSPGMRSAIAFLHTGKLGRVRLARVICYKLRLPIGRAGGPQPVPSTVDYDLWCGPGPCRPPVRRQFHYDWHWFWDYGTGEMGNQAVHQIDVARWGLGEARLPTSVISVGGRFGPADNGETPNTQICVFRYGDRGILSEVRGLPTRAYRQTMLGNVFHGEAGTLICPGYYGGVAYAPDGSEIKRFAGAGDHYGNFLDAVRSRRAADLHGGIEEGHLSSALCHLGNISHRLGTRQELRKSRMAFADDPDASESLARMEEHLRADGVPPEGTPYHLGRRLVLDRQAETVIDDRGANALLTREYRRPFVIPD